MQYMQTILSWQQVSMKNDNFYKHNKIILSTHDTLVTRCLLFQITITFAVEITIVNYEIFYNYNSSNVQ